jgi:hypothetical protein
MINYQRPKARVFAVRQRQPLFNNLAKYVDGTAITKTSTPG